MLMIDENTHKIISITRNMTRKLCCHLKLIYSLKTSSYKIMGAKEKSPQEVDWSLRCRSNCYSSDSFVESVPVLDSLSLGSKELQLCSLAVFSSCVFCRMFLRRNRRRNTKNSSIPWKLRVCFFMKIQDWIIKSERIRKWILRFFTKQINPRSFGSWVVKETEESTFPLTRHDPRDLVLICLVKKCKIHFQILSKNPILDFLKETHP